MKEDVLWQAFRLFDTDNSGKISEAELEMVFDEKNVCDENFDDIWFLRTNLNFSEPLKHSKHPKYGRQQHGAHIVVQNQKIHWPFLHFSWTRTHHWTWPIDRVRSQLFRTFFLDSLWSILRPKRPHLFWKFNLFIVDLN